MRKLKTRNINQLNVLDMETRNFNQISYSSIMRYFIQKGIDLNNNDYCGDVLSLLDAIRNLMQEEELLVIDSKKSLEYHSYDLLDKKYLDSVKESRMFIVKREIVDSKSVYYYKEI